MSQQIAVFLLGISAFPVAKKIAAELGAELHGKADRISQVSPEPEADVFLLTRWSICRLCLAKV